MGRYSTPIQGIIDRINYHATPKKTPPRLLDGLLFIPIPEVDIEAERDLPNVRLFVPDLSERFAPGRNVDGEIQIKVLIGTSRAKGIAEAMRWLEKIMDALQRDQNGQVVNLPGVARHFDYEVKDSYPKDTSLNLPVTIHLQPPKHEVGRRS